MKKWIPVAMVIGLVLAIPLLAVSHEGEHVKGEQHQTRGLFEEGSGSSNMERSGEHMKSGQSGHKMGSEYRDEGHGGMQDHKEGKEYSEKSIHKIGEKSQHKKMKAQRMREGS